jgi:hypothetical protein
MFIDIMRSDITLANAGSEQHRRALLADAEQHRLAAVARAGQRAARRATDLALQRLVAQRTAGGAAAERTTGAPPGADRPTRSRR